MAAQVTLTLPVLRRGDEDPAVVRLRVILRSLLGGPDTDSSKFDHDLEASVKTFQGADAGTLVVDGIVGPRTWTKLLTQWLRFSDPS